MPITKEVADKLAEEAMEKLGRAPAGEMTRIPNASDPADRLRLAANLLGTAIDAHQKSGQALQAATQFFVAEYAAAMGAGVNPASAGAGRSAIDRMATASRPKVFNHAPAGETDGHQ